MIYKNLRKSGLLVLLLFLNISLVAIAQTAQSKNNRPKLIVGIVIDQMRYEYLHRFAPGFGKDGFNRLFKRGFTFKNVHYNYAPTFTGPGHASIYTGTTPSIHGIIGNDYYDRQLKKMVNCVTDTNQHAVGDPYANGMISPASLLATTITDELKLFTNQQSKVISISMKDRGAVLPGGHLADAAYWFDAHSGKMITSSYYMSRLPNWVEQFNNKKLSDIYQESGTLFTATINILLWIHQFTKINFKEKELPPFLTILVNCGKLMESILHFYLLHIVTIISLSLLRKR